MSLIQGGSVESGTQQWSEAARRVADELRLVPDQARMAKVSSLLHSFRGQGIHCDIENMMQALRAEGVATRDQAQLTPLSRPPEPEPQEEELRPAMAFTVQMPALGESVTEGTVTRWLKQEGDQVEVDEPLLEVSTDKVDTEIP
ncbi:MAG: biotin/lipoyl-containing protein, partial [Marmoricola sp.]